ncbi:MAG: terminase family protein [Sphingomonadaceae bacterium]|uniref:DNA-packaging protein n=1 Tax=Thermaurantiacus sp. TaxID=2820283 RepID=UPI00298EF106|nr:terminase family protein [Thermaurantiacus sp.]MCS6987758.1 terminase family protein [Sphingomonadaceae bacterium]MDW8415022.1 terminase family protein [Thermaurantiacus sp.]
MTGGRTRPREWSLLERLARLPARERERCLEGVPLDLARRLLGDWKFRARPSQLPPPGDWSVWLILAGRGFGKTRTGAEWVIARALEVPGCRIALVGATHADALGVMVRGESGILASAPEEFRPAYRPGRRELRWANGSVATLFSAVEPDRLRGPQFHFAWCDELAAWARPKEAWDNLRLGLRLGDRPRLVVTTTPRPTAFVKAVMEAPDTVVTRGSTYDNRINLPASYVRDVTALYAATALGRQELEGEYLDRVPGALWSRDGLERCRKPLSGELTRVVVGVDPPAGTGTCGIVVAGRDRDGRAWVLADASVADTGPDQWAAAVRSAADRACADLVVVETNNGGTMVEQVLRAGGHTLPIRTVKASVGKVARAEPVAALYARGLVHHVQPFRELEDQLCGLVQGGGYVGPGASPDRADALVWALTELMLRPPAGQPSFRVL